MDNWPLFMSSFFMGFSLVMIMASTWINYRWAKKLSELSKALLEVASTIRSGSLPTPTSVRSMSAEDRAMLRHVCEAIIADIDGQRQVH